MDYYWGPEDTSVHFCEDKYIVSPWVAEYANTFSSMAYIYIGILFLFTKLSKLGRSLILVGVGAFTLHMTLRVYAQLFDEIAMLVLSFDAFSHIKKVRRYWLIPVILTYLLMHKYFIYFFIVFASFQIYLAYLGLIHSNGIKRKFIIGYIVLFLVATVCWLLDQFACDYVKDYQLHAFWHIFTALAIGSGFLALLF